MLLAFGLKPLQNSSSVGRRKYLSPGTLLSFYGTSSLTGRTHSYEVENIALKRKNDN